MMTVGVFAGIHIFCRRLFVLDQLVALLRNWGNFYFRKIYQLIIINWHCAVEKAHQYSQPINNLGSDKYFVSRAKNKLLDKEKGY